MQRDRQLASLGRRLAAWGIDAMCVTTGVACATGGMLAWDKLRDSGHGAGLESTVNRLSLRVESAEWRRAGSALALGSAIAERRWRSPGMRLMRIHRADVRTGELPTVRAALICHLVGQANGQIVRRSLGPRFDRHRERVGALTDEVEAARRQHPDDQTAQQQAIHAVYRDAGVNPLSCCWPMFVPTIISLLVTLATPRHQSPAHWLAGIVVVED